MGGWDGRWPDRTKETIEARSVYDADSRGTHPDLCNGWQRSGFSTLPRRSRASLHVPPKSGFSAASGNERPADPHGSLLRHLRVTLRARVRSTFVAASAGSKRRRREVSWSSSARSIGPVAWWKAQHGWHHQTGGRMRGRSSGLTPTPSVAGLTRARSPANMWPPLLTACSQYCDGMCQAKNSPKRPEKWETPSIEPWRFAG